MSKCISDSTDFDYLCAKEDLVPWSGVCALFGSEQIALFYLPDSTPTLYAISNHDPFSRANVLSRGLLSERGDKLAVASPLYKQHFVLDSGSCLEDTSVSVKTYEVQLHEDGVWIRR